MKGWLIFTHSVKLIFRNFGALLRISVVPYSITALGTFLLFDVATKMQSGNSVLIEQITPSQWMGFIFFLFANIVIALWIAVTWHRFVLLEEYPKGWIPRYSCNLMLNYFGKGLLLVLIIFGIMIVPGFLFLRYIVQNQPGSGSIHLLSIALSALALYFYYRFCAALPSSAIGDPIGFGDAWKATKGQTSSIFVLTAIGLIAFEISQLPVHLGVNTVFAAVFGIIIQWITMMFGVTILTTFYGHFIEGREID